LFYTSHFFCFLAYKLSPIPYLYAPTHKSGFSLEEHRKIPHFNSPMPKDTSIKSVLIIGSGPIIIGQACEFDYSGSQAALSLKEEGISVSIINSNPATIMTDKVIADHVYLLPLNCESLEQILREQKIDAVLPTMGGQTALNL